MRDLAEVYDPNLHLPIRGKDYIVPAPTADAGARLMTIAAATTAAMADVDTAIIRDALHLDDMQEEDFNRLALGTAYDDMVADKLPYTYIDHAAQTAWMHWCFGADAATTYWESGGKATAAMTPPPPTISNSTAEATTTKSPAPGNGTRSRPKSSNKRKPKRAAKSSG